jgi:hypothetical protein
MLSHCPSCKYFQTEGCAVNASYHKMTGALRSKLTTPELGYFAPDLPYCSDWERSPALDLLSHELTLTREQWRVLAEAIASQGLAEALPEDLRPNIEPEASGEIVMHEVESSNIEAMGWSAGVC